jgi:hypothetical protein
MDPHPSSVFCQECLQPAGMPCIDGYQINDDGTLVMDIAAYHEERIWMAKYTAEASQWAV